MQTIYFILVKHISKPNFKPIEKFQGNKMKLVENIFKIYIIIDYIWIFVCSHERHQLTLNIN